MVHGSCHGAWCWRDLLPELTARGIAARAIDLPGHGADTRPLSEVTLDAYAEAILAAAEDMGGRVALLGHSMAGYPITAAAQRAPGMIDKLIYLSAYLPESGRSLSDMRAAWPEQPLMPAIRRRDDGLSFTIAEDWQPQVFYHDCPAEAVAFARENLGPQAIAPQATPLDLTAAWEGIESHYIVCADDRTIPPDYQRYMARNLPLERVSELQSSHSPFFAMPGALAERVVAILGD
nr:alpha/beta fold hydrolase [Pararhodobacter sp. SW119]